MRVPQEKVRLADCGYERVVSGLVRIPPHRGEGPFQLYQCRLHRRGRSGEPALLVCGPTGERVCGKEALDRMFHSRHCTMAGRRAW